MSQFDALRAQGEMPSLLQHNVVGTFEGLHTAIGLRVVFEPALPVGGVRVVPAVTDA